MGKGGRGRKAGRRGKGRAEDRRDGRCSSISVRNVDRQPPRELIVVMVKDLHQA